MAGDAKLDRNYVGLLPARKGGLAWPEDSGREGGAGRGGTAERTVLRKGARRRGAPCGKRAHVHTPTRGNEFLPTPPCPDVSVGGTLGQPELWPNRPSHGESHRARLQTRRGGACLCLLCFSRGTHGAERPLDNQRVQLGFSSAAGQPRWGFPTPGVGCLGCTIQGRDVVVAR